MPTDTDTATAPLPLFAVACTLARILQAEYPSIPLTSVALLLGASEREVAAIERLERWLRSGESR